MGYKINTQKSVSFLCINELAERNIKKAILFTNVSKRIKHLGINITKEVKDLHAENYMTLTKEIEEDPNKWKDSPCSWIQRTSL